MGADEFGCEARACFSFSASAARCAMVRFAPFDDGPEENEVESRPLNASAPFEPPVEAPVLLAFWMARGGAPPPSAGDWPGVGVREVNEGDDPAAASIENASFCGLR